MICNSYKNNGLKPYIIAKKVVENEKAEKFSKDY